VPFTNHSASSAASSEKDATMSNNIEGKVVVITGASSGLGAGALSPTNVLTASALGLPETAFG
jgi:hypothetical protein